MYTSSLAPSGTGGFVRTLAQGFSGCQTETFPDLSLNSNPYSSSNTATISSYKGASSSGKIIDSGTLSESSDMSPSIMTIGSVVIIDGDISLLSDRVSESMILPEDDAPLYNEIVAVFEDEYGLEVRLRSGDVSVWQPENPWAKVLTKPPVPDCTKLLVYVFGLNFIGQYDFQFDFSGGKATHVTFVER